MPRVTLTLRVALGSLLCVLAGCNIEPHYRADAVVYDRGLIGTWEFEIPPDPEDQKPPAPLRIQVQSRTLPVIDGRLRPDQSPVNVTPGEPPPAPTEPNAYKIVIALPDFEKPLEYGAFLMVAGDERLLGYQFLGGGNPGAPGMHPLHQVARCRVTGDKLEIAFPKHRLVLLPDARPLDVARPGPMPTLAELESGGTEGMYVIFDVDRLVEVYTKLGGEPGFWGEPVRGHRVPDAAE
jgi:hypothetical protein